MRLISIVLLWLMACCSIGFAQSGIRVDNRDNFVLYFNDSWSTKSLGLNGAVEQMNPPGSGYHRYRVTFEFGGPSSNGIATDTNIELELTLEGPDGISPTTSVQLSIPKNTSRASAEVLLPVSGVSDRVVYKTKVDGEFKADLSGSENLPIYDSTFSSLVFIGDKATHDSIKTHSNIEFNEHFFNMGAAWTSRFEQKRQQARPPNNFYSDAYNVRFAPLDHLPTNYLDWTTVSKIIATADSLAKLDEQQSRCILEHLRSSGSLLIYGEKDCEEIRNQVSDWLAKYSDMKADYWRTLWVTNLQESALDFGNGEINVVGEQSLYKLLTFDDFNIFITPNRSYSQIDRLGRLRGQPFWNWYLTRLGQPPVGAFTLLIVSFAGLFAPALLIYCLRYNRTAWLLVIFPIIAVAGTILMVVYASVHDGFGTYSRVRSMTLLDPNSDKGVCISRQVMFSGLTPREGLSFEIDSEVWQIDAYERGYGKRTTAGRLRWTEQQQVFEKMVTPREQFQFLVDQPVHSLKPFEWIQYPDATANPPVCQIKNSLDEKLQLVLISDGTGNFFFAKDLPAGATSSLNYVDASKAASLLKEKEDSQPLELPAGLRSGPSQNIVSSLGGRSRYSGATYSTQSYDLIDDTMTELIDRNHLATDRCFFVYPEAGGYVDRALANSSEKDSLHMIYGKWEAAQ